MNRDEALIVQLTSVGFSEGDARILIGMVLATYKLRSIEAKVAEQRDRITAAEDFRAEIAIEAFTAPDADWDAILDSLRARIRDLQTPAIDVACSYCGGQGCQACDARALLESTTTEATPTQAQIDAHNTTMIDALVDVVAPEIGCPSCGSDDPNSEQRSIDMFGDPSDPCDDPFHDDPFNGLGPSCVGETP